VYCNVSVTTIVETEGLILMTVAPPVSAARSDPGPSLLPLVTKAAGPANTMAGISSDAIRSSLVVIVNSGLTQERQSYGAAIAFELRLRFGDVI
jgi:hypothetical protein